MGLSQLKASEGRERSVFWHWEPGQIVARLSKPGKWLIVSRNLVADGFFPTDEMFLYTLKNKHGEIDRSVSRDDIIKAGSDY